MEYIILILVIVSACLSLYYQSQARKTSSYTDRARFIRKSILLIVPLIVTLVIFVWAWYGLSQGFFEAR